MPNINIKPSDLLRLESAWSDYIVAENTGRDFDYKWTEECRQEYFKTRGEFSLGSFAGSWLAFWAKRNYSAIKLLVEKNNPLDIEIPDEKKS